MKLCKYCTVHFLQLIQKKGSLKYVYPHISGWTIN